jgi:hypothetical protein
MRVDRRGDAGRRDHRSVGHYRVTPGTIRRPMWEDSDRLVGKKVATTAA